MFHTVILTGHLGRDPEMRYLPDGTAVTHLNLACNRRWSDKATGTAQEETIWFRVSVWGRQAEAANQYLTKGRPVLVEGYLRPDPDTGNPRLFTRSDGSVGTSYELVADRVQFLGGHGAAAAEEAAASPSPANDEMIPF
ncbi:MAG: single-stranded DNA-binding protein [Anaerolineales bacterium]|nr:single-stranded DNA-binding protein [Anaerolineales bacterium]